MVQGTCRTRISTKRRQNEGSLVNPDVMVLTELTGIIARPKKITENTFLISENIKNTVQVYIQTSDLQITTHGIENCDIFMIYWVFMNFVRYFKIMIKPEVDRLPSIIISPTIFKCIFDTIYVFSYVQISLGRLINVKKAIMKATENDSSTFLFQQKYIIDQIVSVLLSQEILIRARRMVFSQLYPEQWRLV